jgi:hypothetical protein
MINSHDIDKNDVCIISDSVGSLKPAADQPKDTTEGTRKRRRQTNSSSAASDILDVESRKRISSSDHDSAPTTAYGQYLKTGTYYLPDSYEEVPADKLPGEPSSHTLQAKKKQNSYGAFTSKKSAWAKVFYLITSLTLEHLRNHKRNVFCFLHLNRALVTATEIALQR